MKKLIILGVGGNCIDILDTINAINSASSGAPYQCIGFLDDDDRLWGRDYYGSRVLGPLDSASKFADCSFVNGIGSPSNFWKKKTIIEKTQAGPERFETIIHPTAAVSGTASLGKGTVILQNVTIASNARLGDHVIVLPNSVISHDSSIGHHCCVAAGVCVSGSVTVGDLTYLGSNSTIIGGVFIGECCLIGMGSVVLNSLDDNRVVAGNPAKPIRKTTEVGRVCTNPDNSL